MAKHKKYCYKQALLLPVVFENQIQPGTFKYTLNYLIGKNMFAIDGCKMPSNASKEWSGTMAGLSREQEKMKKAVRHILNNHRVVDHTEVNAEILKNEEKYRQTLNRQIDKISTFIKENTDQTGKSGKPVKSDITDNDSAKMKTSHGTIQGYDGVASVDDKHQIVVHVRMCSKKPRLRRMPVFIMKRTGNIWPKKTLAGMWRIPSSTSATRDSMRLINTKSDTGRNCQKSGSRKHLRLMILRWPMIYPIASARPAAACTATAPISITTGGCTCVTRGRKAVVSPAIYGLNACVTRIARNAEQ